MPQEIAYFYGTAALVIVVELQAADRLQNDPVGLLRAVAAAGAADPQSAPQSTLAYGDFGHTQAGAAAGNDARPCDDSALVCWVVAVADASKIHVHAAERYDFLAGVVKAKRCEDDYST